MVQLSIITEKSFTTLDAMVEEIHQFQQQLVHLQHQNPSKRKKNYILGSKIKVRKFTKGSVCTG
jgi:hypothetical protein